MAGGYETCHRETGYWQRTFTLITTKANRLDRTSTIEFLRFSTKELQRTGAILVTEIPCD